MSEPVERERLKLKEKMWLIDGCSPTYMQSTS